MGCLCVSHSQARKKFFPVKVRGPWHKLLRAAVAAPGPLGVFQDRLDGATWVSLPMAGSETKWSLQSFPTQIILRFCESLASAGNTHRMSFLGKHCLLPNVCSKSGVSGNGVALLILPS